MSDGDTPPDEPACRGCGQCIGNKPYVHALSCHWHASCFRCSICQCCLYKWYFEKDGNLYCRHDYWSKFGCTCNRCCHLITGPVMVAGEHRFHPECFQCQKCLTYIGDGDTYALVERSRLFCGKCYKEVSRPLLTATPARHKTHCIQLVEIPPTPDGNQRVHVTTQKTPPPVSGVRQTFTWSDRDIKPFIAISELEVSPELESLEIGDRILEVNGSAVQDKSVQEVRALLNCKDPVQITVERDVSPLRVNIEANINSNSMCDISPAPSTCVSSCDSPCSLSSPSPTTPSSIGEKELSTIINDTPVKLRSKGSLRAHGHSPSRRRSKSPSPVPPSRQKSIDLGRSASFHTPSLDHRVFRACDLIPGEVLGQGFFGQAIKVTHREKGEIMVIKELFNFDEEAQKKFLHEVSVLRKLDHPCVLKFLGVLYRDKKLNMVTEYVEGGTLSETLLNQSVDLSWVTRSRFAKDIASGMAYLHSMNIVHRDLNSRNCFLRKDQTVVVADFGLAKILPRHQEILRVEKERNSRTGRKRSQRKKRHTVVGNPYWMAPEMLNGAVYDEKVDVFSYGIIICEIIARISADPDYLPRCLDFGVNFDLFQKKFCQGCPEPFLVLAVLCSQLEADRRPTFEELTHLCEALHLHLEHGRSMPQELQGCALDVYHHAKNQLYGVEDTGISPSASDSGASKRKTSTSQMEEQQEDAH